MKFNQIFAVFKKDFQIESWTKKRFFFEFFAIFLRVSLIFYFSEYLRNRRLRCALDVGCQLQAPTKIRMVSVNKIGSRKKRTTAAGNENEDID